MEFSLDFKGGKCYKVETPNTKKNSSTNNSGKDSNNNMNSEDSKTLKEKMKENAEICEMVGNKSAFVVCRKEFGNLDWKNGNHTEKVVKYRKMNIFNVKNMTFFYM
jgi:hypothetical protein